MKRSLSLIALLTLVLFTVACATTTPATPTVRGKLTAVDSKAITVAPAEGEPVDVTLGWNTQVYWANGVEATGTSVLTTGQTVEVWTKNETATKVVIAQ